MQQEMEQNVLAVRGNALGMEQLTRAYEDFILRAASRTVGREISPNDEEWSIARFAFLRALNTFTLEKGRFFPYAELLIRHRLADHLRMQNQYLPAYQVTAQALESEPEGSAGVRPRSKPTAAEQETGMREEIKTARVILEEYGLTFYDLAGDCPRIEKTRKQCALAIHALLTQPALMARLRSDKRLPVEELVATGDYQKKTLERYQKYIIAAAELLQHDLPRLGEYLKGIGEETAP